MYNLKVRSFVQSDSFVDEINISDRVFTRENINIKLIKHVVEWQRGKTRSGTHMSKSVSDVSGTGKKPHAQKGLGRARKSTMRANHMRGGCVVHGPVNRSYRNIAPPKKMRASAITHALSDKIQKEKVVLFDDFIMQKGISTKECYNSLKKANISSALICVDKNHREFRLSASNIPNVKVVSKEGVNVYDLLKYEHFVTCVKVMKEIQERKKT